MAWDGSLADGIAGQVSPSSGERMGSIRLDSLTHATGVKGGHIFPLGLLGCLRPVAHTLTYTALDLLAGWRFFI